MRSISLVKTPPWVSIPIDSGVTSSSTMSVTWPVRMPAWTAAPMATISSGLTPLCGSWPNIVRTFSWTIGIRVMPPTRRMRWISDGSRRASLIACSVGPIMRSSRSRVMSSSCARVKVNSRCAGPSGVDEIKGRLILAVISVESSILAFSAASFSRCIAIRSFVRSMPVSFLNSVVIQSIIRMSQSSPPRCVSPEVARTSKTPLSSSKIETSNVPPPKSQTSTVCSPVLSCP